MKYIEDIKNSVIEVINYWGKNDTLKSSNFVNNLQPLPLAENNNDSIELMVGKLACSLDSSSVNYKQGCNLQVTDSFCERCQN